MCGIIGPKCNKGEMKMKKKIVAVMLCVCVMLCAPFSVMGLSADATTAAVNETAAMILTKVPSAVFGNEWEIMGLARSGVNVPDGYFDAYYENVKQYVASTADDKGRLHSRKSTENSRLILALSAIGKDSRDVAGKDLIAPLADFNYVKYQGINGVIYALIAIDTYSYDLPDIGDAAKQTDREKCVSYILSQQKTAGGWALFGNAADPDITAMAIQSLSPYYNTDVNVKTAVDNALGVLSSLQQSNGGFSSWGSVNSESCAQVICALLSLGINPETDSRFVKSGGNLLDALMGFYVTGGGFGHTNNTFNGMATQQGFYTLVSFKRFLNSQTGLYNMSDELKNSAANVDSLIEAIGTVNADSSDAINAARNAYNGLIEPARRYVTKLSVLEKAERDFNSGAFNTGNSNTENNDILVPPTSDKSNAVLWSMVMLFSAAALVVLKNKKEKVNELD